MRNMDLVGVVYRLEKCIFVLNLICDVLARIRGI